jgi:hypothetical protein
MEFELYRRPGTCAQVPLIALEEIRAARRTRGGASSVLRPLACSISRRLSRHQERSAPTARRVAPPPPTQSGTPNPTDWRH